MKIYGQVLSREQMAHLEELGVDTSDASMYWIRAERMEGFRKHNIIDNDLGKWRLSLSRKLFVTAAWKVEYIPTYTIGDLIEKLPRHIDGGYETYLSITDDQLFGDWCVCYKSKWGSETDWFTSSNLLTALYDCLCWVAENHKELIK